MCTDSVMVRSAMELSRLALTESALRSEVVRVNRITITAGTSLDNTGTGFILSLK